MGKKTVKDSKSKDCKSKDCKSKDCKSKEETQNDSTDVPKEDEETLCSICFSNVDSVDEKSDKKNLDKINNKINKNRLDINIISLNHEKYKSVIKKQDNENTFSNLASLLCCFEIGKQQADDLVFFVEDTGGHRN